MKYIDADKLIAEIKRLDKENKELLKSGGSIGREFLFGIGAGYVDVIKIIASLQQEPRFPQYDNIVDKVFGAGNLEGFEYHEAEMLVALAKEELLKSLQQEHPQLPGIEEPGIPGKDFIPVEWVDACEMYGKWKIVEQEQPEVDLKKFTEKIKTFQGRYKHPEIVSIKGAMAFMARLFYQYPNVARQWYDNLPKATMD